MDINPRQLRSGLTETARDIERQIEQVHKMAEEMKTDPSRIKDERGNFLMTPLLVAKANVLHALTLLQSK